MFQKMVIETAALFHLLLQERFLSGGRIQTILECFSHIVRFIFYRTMSQGHVLYLRHKWRSFKAFFDKRFRNSGEWISSFWRY